MATSAVSASSVPNVQSNMTNALASAGHAMSQIMGTAQANNAWSASQAEIQRNWQEQQNQKAMDFNAAEAAKNRDWQKMMSDTAHRREIKDLVAAGLNPVLSVTGGNGASVGSGATASGVTSSGAKGQTDMSANTAIVSLLGNLLAQQTQLANANTSALTNLAVADKYNAMSKYTSDLQAQTTLTAANISSMASKYAADQHADASKVSAAIHAAAQRYGTDVSAMTQKEINSFNAEVNKELRQMDINANFDLKDQQFANDFTMKQFYGNGPIGGFIGQVGSILTDLFLGKGSARQTAKTVAGYAYTKDR